MASKLLCLLDTVSKIKIGVIFGVRFERWKIDL